MKTEKKSHKDYSETLLILRRIDTVETVNYEQIRLRQIMDVCVCVCVSSVRWLNFNKVNHSDTKYCTILL